MSLIVLLMFEGFLHTWHVKSHEILRNLMQDVIHNYIESTQKYINHSKSYEIMFKAFHYISNAVLRTALLKMEDNSNTHFPHI